MYRSVSFILLLIRFTRTQDANCDFRQDVVPGRTYYVYSPNYPNSYRRGVQCRWIAQCPSGYNCRVDCTLNIPQTTTCSDRVLISKTGDPQLASADYYCGKGTVSAVSSSQSLSIGLISSQYSEGGNFICKLTAQVSATESCICGYRKRNRIVGGEETKPNEYPMMVAIVYVSMREIKCGGVIISEEYVLTAAHCLIGKPVSELAVVVGEHDVSTGSDSPSAKAYKVASYLIHPQYTASNYDYDIAIIKVEGKIAFNENVGPVCLPFKYINWDFAGARVTLLGWGTLFPGGPKSKVLRKVDVDVISQATCQRTVSSLTPRQICTFTRGKDACQDDSGGPLLYTDPNSGLLFHAGVISYGRFCAESGQPAVNTRVTALLNWILQNAPANYCRK